MNDFEVTMKNIVIPDEKVRSLSFYLAMEEYLAGSMDCEAFFVWRVPPSVIIGRNQILENEVNLDYCAKNGVGLFRRRSGGGCVYSDPGNIMLSYISRRGEVSAVFDRYLSALAAALGNIGLDAVRSGRNDILVNGRKVSGNAFHQLPDRSIVHGTLLHSSDLEALTEAIRPPVEKLQRHGVASVRQRVANLSEFKDISPVLETPESLQAYLTGYFTDGDILLAPEQLREIEDMSYEYIIHC